MAWHGMAWHVHRTSSSSLSAAIWLTVTGVRVVEVKLPAAALVVCIHRAAVPPAAALLLAWCVYPGAPPAVMMPPPAAALCVATGGTTLSSSLALSFALICCITRSVACVCRTLVVSGLGLG